MMKVYVVKGGKEYVNFMSDATLVKRPKDADVIIFTDGPDVCPLLYNARFEKNTHFNSARDTSDIAVFNNVPKDKVVLGFGRGAQLLTVLNGGQLIQQCLWKAGQYNASHDLYICEPDGSKTICPKIQTHNQALYPWKINYQLIAYTKSIRYYSEENKELDYTYNYRIGEPEIILYKSENKPVCIAVQFLPTVYEEKLLNYPLKVIEKLIHESLNK